jgi:hypothetical protein
MAEVQNRIAEYLDHPDDNTRRFHLGDAPQSLPPIDEATEEEEATLKQHRARIHAPGSTLRPRFRDADGEPVETSPLGLAFDEETGALFPTDENGEIIRPAAGAEVGTSHGAARRSARRTARAEAGTTEPPDEADTDDEDEDEADKDKPSRTRPTPQPAPTPAPAPTSSSRPTGAR